VTPLVQRSKLSVARAIGGLEKGIGGGMPSSDDRGDTNSLKNQLSEASWFRVSHRIIKRKYVAMHFFASGLRAF
jgi:hypothetical protein